MNNNCEYPQTIHKMNIYKKDNSRQLSHDITADYRTNGRKGHFIILSSKDVEMGFCYHAYQLDKYGYRKNKKPLLQ